MRSRTGVDRVGEQHTLGTLLEIFYKFTIGLRELRIMVGQCSPILKKYFLQELHDCCLGARKLASAETGILIKIFPVESPFTSEQILDKDLLPESS